MRLAMLLFRIMIGTTVTGASGDMAGRSPLATAIVRASVGGAALAAAIVLVGASCDKNPAGPTAQMLSDCPGPYHDQGTSPYVLPWEVGRSFRIGQGNCGTASHGVGTFDQYAYDMQMPIGTEVRAARAGRVFRFEDGASNGMRIEVLHDDDAVAAYLHLTSALVAVGDTVTQAQVIGLSGHPGLSAAPHLHFHLRVRVCGDCRSLPVTFRNTRPHPQGLVQADTYTALPF